MNSNSDVSSFYFITVVKISFEEQLIDNGQSKGRELEQPELSDKNIT